MNYIYNLQVLWSKMLSWDLMRITRKSMVSANLTKLPLQPLGQFTGWTNLPKILTSPCCFRKCHFYTWNAELGVWCLSAVCQDLPSVLCFSRSNGRWVIEDLHKVQIWNWRWLPFHTLLFANFWTDTDQDYIYKEVQLCQLSAWDGFASFCFLKSWSTIHQRR